MSYEFHSELVVESRADGEAVHELRKHLAALHGVMPSARMGDLYALRQEFEVLRDEFETLHGQDMDHALDRSAHNSWRARMRLLTERVDKVI